MLSALISSVLSYPALPLTRQPEHQRYVIPGPLVLENEPLKFPTPTTWDDSKAIEGKLGEYAVIARRKGDVWYIAGMADWNGKKVSIDLSKILDAGDYEAEIIRDSVNSNIVASDYKRETKTVSSSDILDLEMKNGGGFAVKLTPKKFLWLF